MKKKLSFLLVAFMAIATFAWADDLNESSGNQGANNTAIAGTSYSLDGKFVAGQGSVQQGNMPDKGVKLRSNQGNLVFEVNAGYKITKFEFWGCGNTTTAVDIVSATVDDGTTNLLSGTVTLPAKSASTSGDIVLSDIAAEKNITLTFAEGSSAQIVGTWKVTYEQTAVIQKEITGVTLNGTPISENELAQLKENKTITIDGSSLNGAGAVVVTLSSGATNVVKSFENSMAVYTFSVDNTEYKILVRGVAKTYTEEGTVVAFSANGTAATGANTKTITMNGISFSMVADKTFQYGSGNVTLGENVYVPLKLSTGSAVNVTFPEGKKATKVKIYGWSANGDGKLYAMKESADGEKSVDVSNDVYYATNTGADIYPSVYEYNLDNWESLWFNAGGSPSQPFVVMEFTFAEEQPAEASYYIVGSMNEWTEADAYKFEANPDADGEYMLTTTFEAGAEFKVKSGNTWYPDGENNNYVINEAGEYTVYFRPDGQGGQDWHYGCIYAAKNEVNPEPVDPQPAEQVTSTYIFTTAKWAATLNGVEANWTSGQDGAGFSNNGIQVTTKATGANATSPVSFENVSKIVVTYNTNKSAGAGTLDVQIGDNEAVSKDWAYTPGTADGREANFTVEYTYDKPQSGPVTITANTTTNSIYVVSVAITHDDDGSGGGDQPVNTYTATFKTNLGWKPVYAYAWSGEGEAVEEFLGEWPGTEMTPADELDNGYGINFTAAEAPAFIIFNDGTKEGAVEGVNKTADLAFENGKAYSLIDNSIKTIADLNALASGTEFSFVGNAIVVAKPAAKYVYIKDETGSSLIYDAKGENTANLGIGNVITAPWAGKVNIYNGLFEVEPAAELGTKSTVEVKYPEATAGDVKAENMNQVVEIKGLTIESVDEKGNIKFTIGNAAIVGYNKFGIELPENFEGKTYDVLGAIGIYSKNETTTIQFQPITIKQQFTASFTTDKEWKQVYAYAWTGPEGQETKFLGDWPGTVMTPANGLDNGYGISFTATEAPEFIIFNDGTNDGSQAVGVNKTGDLPFVDGTLYTLTTEKTTVWAGEADKPIPAGGIEISKAEQKYADVQPTNIVRIKAQEIGGAAPARGLGNAVAELAAGDISVYKGSDPTVKLVPDDDIKAIPGEGYEFVADETIANEINANGFIIKSNVPETKQLAITEIEIEEAPEPAVDIEISPESGDIAAALATAVEGKNVGKIQINLTAGGEYTIGSAMVAPGAFTIRGNGATVNVAAEFTGEAIVKMAASAEAPTAVTKVDYISFHDVTFKGLSKPLFYSTQKKYDITWFTIENSVLELTADATTIDFTKGSAARNINVVNSTIYAPTATIKSFYSSQGGEKMTEIDADGTQTFIFKNNTMYNLAKEKNFFSHRQSNQKWLAYDVENNIFVNCGKSGQVIKGMNGGQGGSNPTWTIIGNAFNFDGADTSANEETGDADHTGDETPGLNETVQNSVAGVVAFTDVATGDFNGVFTLAEGAEEPATKPGDPRWTITYQSAMSYYLVGNMNDWEPVAEYKLTANTAAEGVEEYMITVDLAANAQFKIVNSDKTVWYPDGMGNAYGENGELQGAGKYTVYFRPKADGGDDWFYHVIYAQKFYNITVVNCDGMTITPEVTEATAGTKVWATVAMTEGYEPEFPGFTNTDTGDVIEMTEDTDVGMDETGKVWIIMPAQNLTITAKAAKVSLITLELSQENGSATCISVNAEDPTSLYKKEGKEIYLTVTPNAGYTADITVTAGEDPVEVIAEAGTYHEQAYTHKFIMPAKDVTVKVVFTKADAIDGIATDDADDNAPIYNLAGQKVTKSYKGVVIKNGKKYLVK